jgi:hypothetical protein
MVLLILVKTIVGELFQPGVGWVLSKEDFANVKGIDLLKWGGWWNEAA